MHNIGFSRISHKTSVYIKSTKMGEKLVFRFLYNIGRYKSCGWICAVKIAFSSGKLRWLITWRHYWISIQILLLLFFYQQLLYNYYIEPLFSFLTLCTKRMPWVSTFVNMFVFHQTENFNISLLLLLSSCLLILTLTLTLILMLLLVRYVSSCF